MFAVIKTGGKQYKVSSGDLLKVERLEGEAGQSIHLSSVLLLNNEGNITIGSPFLDQIQVRATIVEQARADKIIVFKKKRRQGYRRKAGHRQDITILRVEEILTQGVQGIEHKPKSEAKEKKAAESQETVSASSSTMPEPTAAPKKSKTSNEVSKVDENMISTPENDVLKAADKETKKTTRSSKATAESTEKTVDPKKSEEENQTSTVKKKTSPKLSSDTQDTK